MIISEKGSPGYNNGLQLSGRSTSQITRNDMQVSFFSTQSTILPEQAFLLIMKRGEQSKFLKWNVIPCQASLEKYHIRKYYNYYGQESKQCLI